MQVVQFDHVLWFQKTWCQYVHLPYKGRVVSLPNGSWGLRIRVAQFHRNWVTCNPYLDIFGELARLKPNKIEFIVGLVLTLGVRRVWKMTVSWNPMETFLKFVVYASALVFRQSLLWFYASCWFRVILAALDSWEEKGPIPPMPTGPPREYGLTKGLLKDHGRQADRQTDRQIDRSIDR